MLLSDEVFFILQSYVNIKNIIDTIPDKDNLKKMVRVSVLLYMHILE